jgi:Ras GTPase-activating-like protein IQGAP2/3
LASLSRLVSLGEIDNLLQTVMFTLYGNQYDQLEEHLLLSLFKEVLQEEFALANDLGSLLRANTAITRMMTTYTRRGPGQSYLRTVLGTVLQPILDGSDLELEVNPVKVYEFLYAEEEKRSGSCSKPKSVDTETAAADPDVQALMGPRLKELERISQHVVDGIIAAINDVPYGIRWICQQIRVLVREKFADVTREQVCSLIGGFFLLRFVNPAVVTPQAFLMVENKTSAQVKRNLTILAKVLQNLANNVKFGGVKETYMEPLNGFLSRAGPRLNAFLEELTRVSSLEERLQLDHFVALAKRDQNQMIHITLNEMYSCSRLLQKHVDVVCPDAADPLRKYLKELGAPPENVPRKDNLVVDLKLIEDRTTAAALDDERPEQLYSDTKWLLFSIVRAVPSLDGTADVDANLRLARQFADTNKNAALAERVEQTCANLERLCALGRVSRDDNFAQLRRDVVEETLQYEKQIGKTTADLKMLRTVYRDVMERNDFLQEQLAAYKQYLNNVRATAATTTKSKSARSGTVEARLGMASDAVATYTHAQLEKDGVITSSDVPAERRPNITLQISSKQAGIYTVAVLYKSRQISEMTIKLDDLLERQHKGKEEIATEFMRFNVNLLLLLLNKIFL